MMVEVEGLGVLEFPDGTPPNVIEAAVKRTLAEEKARAPKPPSQAGLEWSNVPARAMLNLPSSTAQFARDVAEPLLHPIETAKTVGRIGTGAAQRAGEKFGVNLGWDTATLDAITQFFKNRYGSTAKLKETLATDPVGAAADLATVLTGGGAMAARAPGIVGTAGRAAQTVGRVVDPALAAGRIASLTGGTAGQVAAATLGLTTGAGHRAIEEAARAGRSASLADRTAFLESLRGRRGTTQTLNDALAGLRALRDERSATYQRHIGLVKADKTALDFAPIVDAWNNVQRSYLASGDVSRIGARTQATLRQIGAVIEEWARTPAAHTIDGLDALKQRIRDEAGNFSALSEQEQRAVTIMTQAVGREIERQAPQYAQIMQQYTKESRLIDEIEQALSLGNDAARDTAIRKLLSAMRDSVQTNYGRRTQLVEEVERARAASAPGTLPLMPQLAGHSLRPMAPRGFARIVAGGNIAGSYFNPASLAMLPAQSPRLVGETSFAVGRTIGALRDAARAFGVTGPRIAALEQAAFQLGRPSEEERRRRSMIGLMQ